MVPAARAHGIPESCTVHAAARWPEGANGWLGSSQEKLRENQFQIAWPGHTKEAILLAFLGNHCYIVE